MNRFWTVTIIEDNDSFAEALGALVDSIDNAQVLARYRSVEEMKQKFPLEPTDLAIVDIRLPDGNGLELLQFIKLRSPETLAVICTSYSSDDYLFQALKIGAIGYILKDHSLEQMKRLLIEVLSGGAIMSPVIAKKVMASFVQFSTMNSIYSLTQRENEVLQMLSDGFAYKQIAASLFVTIDTIKKHIKNIYRKLEVTNKVEATIKWKNL